MNNDTWGPYTISEIKESDGTIHYRIADREDNRIATCWVKENAEHVLAALNHYEGITT